MVKTIPDEPICIVPDSKLGEPSQPVKSTLPEPDVAQASSLPVHGASCPAVMAGWRDATRTGRLEACATKVRFIVPMHAQKRMKAFHETPFVWSSAFRRYGRIRRPAKAGTPNNRFMVPMRGRKVMRAFHEPFSLLQDAPPGAG